MSINHQQQLLVDSSESSSSPRESHRKNFGRWTSEQQLKYIAFLDFFKDDLKISQKRKYFKIFKMMGEFIKTRDGIQCRSHHMKQLKSFKKVQAIIKKFKKNLSVDTLAAYELCITEISNQYSGNTMHSHQRNGQESQKIAQNPEFIPISGNGNPSESRNRNLVSNYAFSQQLENNCNNSFGIYFIPNLAGWGRTMGSFPYITYNI